MDVHDAADLHPRAMTHPQAAGRRFIGVAGPSLAQADLADILRAHLELAATRVPTRKPPNWQVRLFVLFGKQARATVPNPGEQRQSSNAKARQMLGRSPGSSEETILASAQNLIQLREVSI